MLNFHVTLDFENYFGLPSAEVLLLIPIVGIFHRYLKIMKERMQLPFLV
jgi:hypothetical protein